MYLWPSASTMGKSFEKEHKKVWAVNARLACEAKKAEAPLDPTSMDPAPSSAGDNTPVEPIKPKAHSWEPHVPTTRWNPPHLQSSSATLSSVPQNALSVPTLLHSRRPAQSIKPLSLLIPCFRRSNRWMTNLKSATQRLMMAQVMIFLDFLWAWNGV